MPGRCPTFSFVLDLLRSIIKWPDWTMNLSIFHVYGQPMDTGINWTGTLVMLALALALLLVGTLRFARDDMSD